MKKGFEVGWIYRYFWMVCNRRISDLQELLSRRRILMITENRISSCNFPVIKFRLKFLIRCTISLCRLFLGVRHTSGLLAGPGKITKRFSCSYSPKTLSSLSIRFLKYFEKRTNSAAESIFSFFCHHDVAYEHYSRLIFGISFLFSKHFRDFFFRFAQWNGHAGEEPVRF